MESLRRWLSRDSSPKGSPSSAPLHSGGICATPLFLSDVPDAFPQHRIAIQGFSDLFPHLRLSEEQSRKYLNDRFQQLLCTLQEMERMHDRGIRKGPFAIMHYPPVKLERLKLASVDVFLQELELALFAADAADAVLAHHRALELAELRALLEQRIFGAE